jgi:catechol-2,3-dioxygenase
MFGIFEVDGTENKVMDNPGLHHFQLAHENFDELFARYEHLKTKGIFPIKKWNHGVMTSFYYEDPDGNQAEMTCLNFAKEEDFRNYFNTDAYKNNISGIPINPGDYIALYRAGTPQEE